MPDPRDTSNRERLTEFFQEIFRDPDPPRPGGRLLVSEETRRRLVDIVLRQEREEQMRAIEDRMRHYIEMAEAAPTREQSQRIAEQAMQMEVPEFMIEGERPENFRESIMRNYPNIMPLLETLSRLHRPSRIAYDGIELSHEVLEDFEFQYSPEFVTADDLAAPGPSDEVRPTPEAPGSWVRVRDAYGRTVGYDTPFGRILTGRPPENTPPPPRQILSTDTELPDDF